MKKHKSTSKNIHVQSDRNRSQVSNGSCVLKRMRSAPGAPALKAVVPGFSDTRTGTGTDEWSDGSYNICAGCEHDCLYCYAKHSQAVRFGRIKVADWPQQKVLDKKVAEASKVKSKGVLMFPTSHDLVPSILTEALETINSLIDGGNKVLVVSKPHLCVVQALCKQLKAHKERLMFRFTIGSRNEAVCKLWEPGAPSPDERIAALKHAFGSGYQTSVSVEPMLMYSNDEAVALFGAVEGFVTDTVWFGKMNGIVLKLDQARPGVTASYARIKAAQADDQIRALYHMLRHEPKVRWKDSVKKVVSAGGQLKTMASRSGVCRRPN